MVMLSSATNPVDESADVLRGPMLMFRLVCSMPFLAGSPGATAPWTLLANLLLCVGLPYRGMGFAAAGVPILGLAPGVNCTLRTGDSGRREGRGFLARGLDARPGPMDLLNWGTEGVCGVLVEFCVPTFKPPVAEAGVMGKELVAELGGESRRMALLRGRNMPAPGMVVVK